MRPAGLVPLLGEPLLALDFVEIERLRQPVVYVWTRGEDVLYVGMSQGGVARPIGPSHEKLRHFRPGDCLAIWVVRDAPEIEIGLIQRLRPAHNSRGGPRPCPGCGFRLPSRRLICPQCERRPQRQNPA